MDNQAVKSVINGLEPDILTSVVKTFAIEPHETGYPLSSEAEQNKANLVSLCRTSHQFRFAATPYLYNTVILSRARLGRNCDSLVLFLRSLAENPLLRSRVKHLACLINLAPASPTIDHDSDAKFINTGWEKLSPGLTVSTSSDIHLLALAGLAATALANGFSPLLCLATGLESVLFQVPIQHPLDGQGKWKYAVASSIINKVLRDPEIGQTVLQKLTTVKVQPDMEHPLALYEGAAHIGIGCDACPGLFEAPNVTTVEAFKESCGWEALPRGIKDLSLYGIIKPETLGIISGYPMLERLTVQPAPEGMAEAVLTADVFNTGLAKLAPTLRYLDFQTMANTSLTSSYGPTKCLGSLVQLTQLEDLLIEIFALFGTSARIDQLALADVVPGSLKKLVLTERWVLGDPILTTKRDRLGPYREKMMRLLVRFAEDCPSRMPNLRNFVLVRHGDMTEEVCRPESPAFERLKLLFTNIGVKLSLECF
ncbi:hypothetical protein MKZ38_000407 [Zalerion maritima]|uniref:Uncharacterized protein n=1 Tax=Zalerion maritima TaxID=339359 RepID=A0AAD5RZF7_9PEZI|nr:hypothetical protein MKZ38_000407 [Zalerion maritima]